MAELLAWDTVASQAIPLMFGAVGGGLASAVVAIWINAVAQRTRKADSFARLYDEFNTTAFGTKMECIGEWIDDLATRLNKGRQDLTAYDVRRAYRDHLMSLKASGKNTKLDPIESARREVKSWFIKCLLYRNARDLSRQQMRGLITRDRAALMLFVIAMTREQTDFWKRLAFDPTSGNTSDDPFFVRLEQFASRQGVRPMLSHNSPRHVSGLTDNALGDSMTR